ncbi:putative methylaconitate Delta-isomerase PrpF, partial [Vibrio cholerae]|nr:putative methylaconitate Delta-isomerase PrpF [Vibrio cholerae]
KQGEQGWQIERAIMSRSARILMEGWVRVPENYAALSESKE